MPHTQGKKGNQQKMFCKGTQILDLVDKDFISAIINIFKLIKENHV